MKSRSKRVVALLAVSVLALSAPADARRGGSFGSRGSRTYMAPRSTQITPGYVPGVSRSMTAPSAYGAQRYQPSFQSPGGVNRPRFGFGSGLLAGVVTGGLLGNLFGHGGGGYGAGYGGGGGGGMLALLIQLAIIGGIAWFALRLFRGSRQGGAVSQPFVPSVQSFAPPSNFAADPVGMGSDISIDAADQRAFETLLVDLQDAFGREDYAKLRAITTPEIMSYLAEELSDNATHGRRNAVSDTRLIDAEVSEAWREGDTDYATIAMRYESIDVMRDRTSGAVLSGDASRPTLATEVWTFTRPSGPWAAWKVSAIQEA